MAVITQTPLAGVTDMARTVLSASDTFVYTPNTGQVLEIANNTAGLLTALIKGSAPSAAFPVPGSGGTTVDLSAGKSVAIAASKTFRISLDSIASYLTGNGTVTVTGVATCVATLVA